MSDPVTRAMDNLSKRRDARDLETVREAILELHHGVIVGQKWLTNGAEGQRAHLRMWVQKAGEAVKAIEETLEQAQDCIMGETPEDCTVEDARADTLAKIRTALGLEP